MLTQPKLTICVPSRNRQRYLQETIRSHLITMRTDVEFVFADNSDDPAIMNDFMKDVLGDPRVRYLPSVDRVLPMVENWDRCVEAATGEFICMIGDDDYVDVNVADVIIRSQAAHPLLDVFVWNRLTYNWPNNRPNHCNVAVPLKTGVHRVPRAAIYQEFFSWRGGKASPNMAFGFYHGAVSKRVMDKIKSKFGGKYCEYPVVDFENCCKVAVTAENMFFTERPFSILGSCAQSNSARIKTIDKVKEQHAAFMAETGRNIDDDPHMKTFPFPSILGLVACIGQTQHWFLTTYGYSPIEGWEANFAEACGMSCNLMGDRPAYDATVQAYRDVLSGWHDGTYLMNFNPLPFVEPAGAKFFTGIAADTLLVDEEIGAVETPAELYHVIDQMLVPPQELTYDFNEHYQAA